MEKYSDLVMSYIEAMQRNYLMLHGVDVEQGLDQIFPNKDKFADYMANNLEQNIPDEDERYRLEALIRNEISEDLPNLSKYESYTHRKMMLGAEQTFLSLQNDDLNAEVPYCATLYSDDVNAEIVKYEVLDKPIIFFHGGLFIASMLFCKLYVHLLKMEESSLDVQECGSPAYAEAKVRAAYFFNHYFSQTSKQVPQYNLPADEQNSVLYQLLESAYLFIYSHEVGHADRGHFGTHGANTEMWENEFEADEYAVSQVIELYRSKPFQSPITLIGPLVFFKYRFFLEQYRPELGELDSHPPTLQRMKHYCIALDNQFEGEEKEEIRRMLGIEHHISNGLRNMFNDFDVHSKTHMIYFAYGSNMLTHRLEKRIGKTEVLGTATLRKHRLVFNKLSRDKSLKADAFYTASEDDVVIGVIYKIEINRKADLDRAEGFGKGYALKKVEVLSNGNPVQAHMYIAEHPDNSGENLPYDWYVELILAGAREHMLPTEYVRSIMAQQTKKDADVYRTSLNRSIIQESNDKIK